MEFSELTPLLKIISENIGAHTMFTMVIIYFFIIIINLFRVDM